MSDQRESTMGAPENPTSDPDDKAIRERVRDLTTQVLQRGYPDPDGVRDVMRAVTGASRQRAPLTEAARQAFSDDIKALDASLIDAAHSAHASLEQLASRGKDFTDNDLKDVLASLEGLQKAFVTTTKRVADVASGDLQHELGELAAQAQRAGTEASARVAGLLTEFASNLGSASREKAEFGLEAARDFSTRMALLSSGVLAGIADALSQQPGRE